MSRLQDIHVIAGAIIQYRDKLYLQLFALHPFANINSSLICPY